MSPRPSYDVASVFSDAEANCAANTANPESKTVLCYIAIENGDL
jgi:hypothetical protein